MVINLFNFQEWEILCRNFEAENGELLLNSFVALHQVLENFFHRFNGVAEMLLYSNRSIL